MKIDEIIIRGERQESSESTQSTDLIQLKHSFAVGGSTRGPSESHTVKLEDDNIIELIFEDTTTWFCSPNTIEEVFSKPPFPERLLIAASGNTSSIVLGLQNHVVVSSNTSSIMLSSSSFTV